MSYTAHVRGSGWVIPCGPTPYRFLTYYSINHIPVIPKALPTHSIFIWLTTITILVRFPTLIPRYFRLLSVPVFLQKK